MAITIHTHAAIQVLKAAGADPKLAEAIVKTVSQADAQLATKADVAAFEGRIDALGHHLTAAGYRLAPGVVVANAAIMFGLLKLILPAQARHLDDLSIPGRRGVGIETACFIIRRSGAHVMRLPH